MTRRAGPEEAREAMPLFDRVEVGMTRAIEKAESVEDGWRARAVEAVRVYALSHETFISQDVRDEMGEPDEADGRAWGAVIRDAASAGYIESAGQVRDKWGSWKTLWRSLLR